MELTFFGKNKVIGITNDIDVTNDTDVSLKDLSPKIYFNFSTFIIPKDFEVKYSKSDSLNIIVDHNFETNSNTVIIDHHLIEETFNKRYKSNSFMMVENFNDIYNTLYGLIDSESIYHINVWMHSDLDGLCSGIIMKDMLNHIYSKDKGYNIEKAIDNIKFAMIIGNYGDIDENASLDLSDYFDTEKEIDIFNKKVKSWCTGISRYLKAIRSPVLHNPNVYYDFGYCYGVVPNELSNKFENEVIPTRDAILPIISIYNYLYETQNINLKSIIIFFNTLAQNNIIKRVLDIYNKISEDATNNYISPNISCYEMTIMFKEDTTKTKYKLLVVDSSLDIGRSVLWKYRSYYRSATKKNINISEWYYKITDWDSTTRKITDTYKNIVCYNKTLNKLSFDSENNSAYDIAKVLNGGGHGDMDEGNSLGSVVIDNYDTFINSFIVVDLF